MIKITLVLLMFSLSSLALAKAQVELPPEIANDSERLEFTGFGGRNKGTFQVAEFRGSFTRGETRLSMADSKYVSNKGKSSFVLLDSDATEIASASCQFSRNTLNISVVTFDSNKLTYECEFRRDGEMLDTHFFLGQPKAEGLKARALAMERRRGESFVSGMRLEIESLHKYQGSKFQSSAPIGYLLTRDNTAVAVIDLTDMNPTLYIAKNLDTDLRKVAVVSALGLAVLRDPATSALED